MITISIVNIKGGTGKTTTAINLVGEIARREKRVLYIDNDPQRNGTIFFNEEFDLSLYDLYAHKKVSVNDCVRLVDANISIIPNVIKSAKLVEELHSRGNKENILKMKLEALDEKFDFCIIDNNPAVSIMLKNSLVISDYYLEVIDNSTDAIEGLNMVEETIQELKDDRLISDIKSIGILRSKFDKITTFSKQFSEVMESNYKDKVFNSIVYDSVKYKEARAVKKFIHDYSREHAEAYSTLYDEIISRLEPMHHYEISK